MQDEFNNRINLEYENAKNFFFNREFTERMYLICELMSPGIDRLEAMSDLEGNMDSIIESYRKFLELDGNGINHLVEPLKILERNKEVFIEFVENLEFACFVLMHN